MSADPTLELLANASKRVEEIESWMIFAQRRIIPIKVLRKTQQVKAELELIRQGYLTQLEREKQAYLKKLICKSPS